MKSFKSLFTLLFLAAALFGCTTLSTVKNLDQPETLAAEVKAQGHVVLTTWLTTTQKCPPCDEFRTKLPDFQEKYGDKLVVILVDANKFPMPMFGIRSLSVPFYAISVNGKLYTLGNGDLKTVEESLDGAVAELTKGSI